MNQLLQSRVVHWTCFYLHKHNIILHIHRTFYLITEKWNNRLTSDKLLITTERYTPKISALLKLAQKLDTYNERNYETSFVSYFSQKGFRQFCEIKEISEQKVGYKSCSAFPLNLGIYYSRAF